MIFVLLLLAVTTFPQPVELFPTISSNVTKLATLNSTNTEDRDAKIEILNQIKTKFNEMEKRMNSSTSELEGLTDKDNTDLNAHLFLVDIMRANQKSVKIIIDQLAAENPDTLKMSELRSLEESTINLEASAKLLEDNIRKYKSKLKEETSKVKTTKQEVEKHAKKGKHQDTKEEHDAKIKLLTQIKAKHEIVDKQINTVLSHIEKEPLIGSLFSPMVVASQNFLKRVIGKYDAENVSNLKIEELEAVNKEMTALVEEVGRHMIKFQSLINKITKKDKGQTDQKEDVTGEKEQELSHSSK